MIEWNKYTAEEIWDSLTSIPKVAGPWQERFTETQRVNYVYVRSIRIQHSYDLTSVLPKYTCAMVWGPLSDGQWIYATEYQSRHAANKDEAMAEADKLLSQSRWRLVGLTFIGKQELRLSGGMADTADSKSVAVKA